MRRSGATINEAGSSAASLPALKSVEIVLKARVVEMALGPEGTKMFLEFEGADGMVEMDPANLQFRSVIA